MHHALADGTACMRYGRTLLWDDVPESTISPVHASAVHAADESRRRAHLAGFLSREYARRAASLSPFDGAIGTRREGRLRERVAARPARGRQGARRARASTTPS